MINLYIYIYISGVIVSFILLHYMNKLVAVNDYQWKTSFSIACQISWLSWLVAIIPIYKITEFYCKKYLHFSIPTKIKKVLEFIKSIEDKY